MADDRLAITIKHSDGTQDRWGPDEPNGHDVPDNLQFTTSIPGGFKDCSCSLARDMSIYQDENLFDPVLVYGSGGDIIWEGRMAAFPRTNEGVTPAAVGMVAHLQDDPSAREIYVDRDLTRWGPVSLNRKAALAATVIESAGALVPDPATGKPVLDFTLMDAWTTIPQVEMVYDAGAGQNISAILVTFFAAGTGGGGTPGGGAWSAYAYLSTDDAITLTDASGNFDASNTYTRGSPNSGWVSASTQDRRFALLTFYYGGVNSGTDGVGYHGYFSPVVYGASNFGGEGTLADGSQGFFASSIIDNIVSRWAPMLKHTYPGSIEQTSFLIPQFAQYTATTSDLMIQAANVFDLKDWGVYSGGEDNYPSNTFFYREPSADRLTWHARRSDGAVLTSEGIQAEDMVNGVIVNYNAPDGTAQSVGPPGSGMGYIDTSLLDSDPLNPVNAAGIPRKYGILNYSGVLAFPTDAVKLGYSWLSRRLGVQRRGTLTCTGWVKHPSGAMMPVAKMRAGDYVVVDDDKRNTGPRKIINTSYTHATRTNTMDLDFDAFRIDALMAQMGVELVGVN